MNSFKSLLVVAGLAASVEASYAAPGQVLILDSSVTGGLSSLEAAAVTDAGKTPILINAATWASMSAAQFAEYDAIVLGDATCSLNLGGCIQAPIDSTAIWGPVIDGNVIIIGSDPVYHSTYGPFFGPKKLIKQGIAFAINKPGKTGAYIDLSCYYHNSGANTPVSVLNGLNGGGFSVIGGGRLPGLNNVKIVASHPSLAGLADADLSNWQNSVHEAFNTWPNAFDVLAIAIDPSGSYTASDGSRGYPYILARGEELVLLSDITLTPKTASNPIGATHTVTATVKENNVPVVGRTVSFSIISGPNAGKTGSGDTDNNGQTTFSYVGMSVGTDTIQGSYTDSLGRVQFNKATKDWVMSSAPTLTSTLAGNRGYYKLTAQSDTYAASDLQIFVSDSASAFVAGPYTSGTVVRIMKLKSGSPSAVTGPTFVTITLKGNGQAYAVDPVPQSSTTVLCRP